MQNVIAAAKRSNKKKILMSAYDAYAAEAPGALDRLLLLVREFAYTKVYHLENEFRSTGTPDTADDWAQEVTLKVWSFLAAGNDFKSEVSTPAEAFYNMVHKAAFNEASDGFKRLDHQRKNKVSLTVAFGEEEGEYEEIDNPEIYRGGAGYGNVAVVNLPSDLKGLDLDIVRLMMEESGLTYKQMGEILGVTENAVKMRTRAMRKRYNMKADESEAGLHADVA